MMQGIIFGIAASSILFGLATLREDSAVKNPEMFISNGTIMLAIGLTTII